MIRYGFSIRTRSGQRVENISILAVTREDAERRLLQMYQKCEVLECRAHTTAARQVESLDLATVIEMMSAFEQPLTISPVIAASINQAGS